MSRRLRAALWAGALFVALCGTGSSRPGTGALQTIEPWFRSQEAARCFPFLANGVFRTARNEGRDVVLPRPFLIDRNRVHRALAGFPSFPRADEIYHEVAANAQGDVVVRMARTRDSLAWEERAGIVAGQLHEDWIVGYMPLDAGSRAPASVVRGDIADALEAITAKSFSGILAVVPREYRIGRCGMAAILLTDSVSAEQQLALVFDAKGHIVAAAGFTTL